MEATTGTKTNSDFGSLLDDLFVAREQSDDMAARPSIPFDYLSVVNELHSGRIRVSSDAAAAEYRDAEADAEAATYEFTQGRRPGSGSRDRAGAAAVD